MKDLIFIDCETTGLDPETDEMVSFAAIRLNGSQEIIKDKLVFHFYPHGPIHPKALAVNKYSEAEWKERGAEFLTTAQLGKLSEFMREGIICGHNVNFDMSFLRAAYKRCRFPFAPFYHTLDTVTLAMPLMLRGEVESVSLANLMTHFGMGEQTHTAESDVTNTVKLFFKLMLIEVYNK